MSTAPRLLIAVAAIAVLALVPASAFAPAIAVAPAIVPALAFALPTTAAERRLDLAAAEWTRNGVAAEPVVDAAEAAAAEDPAAPRAVHLPFEQRGVRWAARFETDGAATVRLVLDWTAGPDGLLFELVLDGERLAPPRDGWRPTPRAVSTDLGSAWLGHGAHLLEFVAREQSPGAALHLHALRLQSP